MSAHMEFWLEVRRAIARWTGVMIASVICGPQWGRRDDADYEGYEEEEGLVVGAAEGVA